MKSMKEIKARLVEMGMPSNDRAFQEMAESAKLGAVAVLDLHQVLTRIGAPDNPLWEDLREAILRLGDGVQRRLNRKRANRNGSHRRRRRAAKMKR